MYEGGREGNETKRDGKKRDKGEEKERERERERESVCVCERERLVGWLDS